MPATAARLVLLLDPDTDSLALYSYALAAAGLPTLTASRLGEAILQLAAVTPDVVITSFALPDGTGLDLVRTMRAEPATSGVPIIGITAAVLPAAAGAAFAAGCETLLTKPCLPETLIEAVARALQRRDAGDSPVTARLRSN